MKALHILKKLEKSNTIIFRVQSKPLNIELLLEEWAPLCSVDLPRKHRHQKKVLRCFSPQSQHSNQIEQN